MPCVCPNLGSIARRCVPAWLALCVLAAAPQAPASDADVAATELAVLIDVSGSMLKNDPQNLRVPALRLVSELLPAGTRAGVWLFADDATPLLATAPVDGAWREQARGVLPEIHSRGQFTHIEAALDAALESWSGSEAAGERHVVLLTDGMVDVPAGVGASAASRARILAGQLERVRAFDARIHAVALSEHADHELLEALTRATGGHLEQAADAAALQRIFLRMLEQSAAPVTVPIRGREFDIDASVSELTLLIFREAGGDGVTVHTPGGRAITAADAGDGVAWLSESGYDLITVAAPEAGTWSFDGDEDPDNRAVVVTDLGLGVDAIPGTLLASEVVDFDAWITEKGQPLERVDLLELVQAEVEISDQAATIASTALPFNPAVRRYEGRLDGRALPAGDYRLRIGLDGGTFKRELNRRLSFVADPVALAISHPADALPTLTITADLEQVQARSLGGYVSITDADGFSRALPLGESLDGRFALELPGSMDGAHTVAASLYLLTRHGRSIQLRPAPMKVELTGSLPARTVAEVPPAAPAPEVSWGLVVAYVLIGNVMLGLGFIIVWAATSRAQKTLEPAGDEPELEAAAA